jgi:hypothetical protein
MASLTDLFNPTFLMFLGILVLVVALLVVYFESKIREQNHIINSMLSLVSTLADDMNNIKIGINHLSIRGGQQPEIPIRENLGISEINKLIEVSDDEEEEEEDEESDEESNNIEDYSENIEDYSENIEDYSENIEDYSENIEDDLESIERDAESDNGDGDIKIIKLQVSNEDLNENNDSYEDANNLDFVHDLADLLNDDLNEVNNLNEEISNLHCDNDDLELEVNNVYVEEVLGLKYDDEVKNLEETNISSSSDLKTISINLGEEHQQHEDNIDYKKLQLAKLRSIAVEKGLTNNSDVSKLKKPELLKLLGAE